MKPVAFLWVLPLLFVSGFIGSRVMPVHKTRTLPARTVTEIRTTVKRRLVFRTVRTPPETVTVRARATTCRDTYTTTLSSGIPPIPVQVPNGYICH